MDNNLSSMAVADLDSAMVSGKPIDFEVGYGMARVASRDPMSMSMLAKKPFRDSAEAESWTLGEVLDHNSEIMADLAIRETQSLRRAFDMDTMGTAFGYSGISGDDATKVMVDRSLGDGTAFSRVVQKFYFG